MYEFYRGYSLNPCPAKCPHFVMINADANHDLFSSIDKWNNEAADALDPLAGGQVYRHGYGFVAVPVLDGSPR